MGLDVSHGAWCGGYGRFNRWRTWLARHAGIPLGLMEQHGAYIWDQSDREALRKQFSEIWMLDNSGGYYHTISAVANFGKPIPWSVMNGDPLLHLLHHSDCDGKIHWWKCKKLALRLLEIYRKSLEPAEREADYSDADDLRKRTLKFACGAARAAKAREHLVFA